MSADASSDGTGPRAGGPAGPARPFHAVLRAATRADHDVVDALFGTFGLADAGAYGRFLTAHARALLPIEAWLAKAPAGPGREDRGPALRTDLAALGLAVPEAVALDWPADMASLWGAAYVTEGSRLGGAMLARQVPAGLPRAYLGSVHPPGGWRNFLETMEREAALANSAWRNRAIESARRTFATFAQAARSMGDP